MNVERQITAASTATQPPMGAAAAFPPQAAEGGAAANRGKIYGPLTTHALDGAGGPFNKWDSDIAGALRRGNPDLAARLRQARARINLAFGLTEKVWVPTEAQRTMIWLRAGAAVNGVSTAEAA